MASSRGYVVPVVACLSVAGSLATLVADRDRGQLPSATVNVAVIGAAAAVMAVLLRRRMPANHLWRVLLVVAVNGPLALVLYASWVGADHPSRLLVGALWLLDPLLVLPWVLFVGLFPDGHRPVRAWTRLVVLGALLLVGASVAAWLTAPVGAGVPVPGHLAGVTSGAMDGSVHAWLEGVASALAGLPLAALGGLAWRYRLSGPVVRQQIRVGIVGLTTSVVLEIALRIVPGARSGGLQVVLSVVAVGVGQLAVGAALLRWRLWVVDQALPRAVALGACSAAFTGLIVAGALLVTGQVGRPQLRVAVVSAGVVTVFVQGYSRRLEPWVRTMLYGERPSGFAVLVGLADGLAAADDQVAAGHIADATRRGLAVPWAAIWTSTAREHVYRLTASTGNLEAGGVITLDPASPEVSLRTRLLGEQETRAPWPQDTAAFALLGPELRPWGLLAVGQRRGDPLTGGDVELLAAIARESELARTNRLLRDEVAASVEILQARATALKASRQRLVAAQDEERRRIERDLHDGTQHELITLAAGLRQLARGGAASPTDLEQLADQAEQAVFSLQDLARGIYPSVLTDHGLVAAIRSLAGRLPMDVSLQATPDVSNHRLPPEVEAALYFVASESLGNSRKHARPTTSTVTLAERDGQVTLEVYDDGCGFDTERSHPGSGLRHMEDRMAALGGNLTVHSLPGAGTWVVVSLPLASSEGTPAVNSRSQTP